MAISIYILCVKLREAGIIIIPYREVRSCLMYGNGMVCFMPMTWDIHVSVALARMPIWLACHLCSMCGEGWWQWQWQYTSNKQYSITKCLCCNGDYGWEMTHIFSRERKASPKHLLETACLPSPPPAFLPTHLPMTLCRPISRREAY